MGSQILFSMLAMLMGGGGGMVIGAEHDGKILADLPESLQDELKLFMKIKFIRKLAIFRDLSHECLRSIALSLKQEFYTPGQYIVRNGDEGECLKS